MMARQILAGPLGGEAGLEAGRLKTEKTLGWTLNAAAEAGATAYPEVC